MRDACHTVAARLAECAAVRKSSHIGAQLHLHNIFKIWRRLHTSMPHPTPKEMTLGEYPDPVLEVSFTFNSASGSSAAWHVLISLDIHEINWLGAVARMQARTSTAMVRREQHKRFHEWVLFASGIPVLLVQQVLAHCAGMSTIPTSPDRSAKFPRKEVSSDPLHQPS